MMRKPILGLIVAAIAGPVLLRAAALTLKRKPLLLFVLVCGVFVWSIGAGGVIRHPAPEAAPLRVCADPNNLPFSNEAKQGFENELARILAKEMGAPLQFTWWAQRRGNIRSTLNEHQCDVLMGVPTALDLVLTTRPYYRSTYVFVWRADRPWSVESFDDEILRRVKVGVQLVGDDFANAPPAHALASRGIVANVRGYSVYGNYTEANPPARIVDAVAQGEIDVAVAWGPMAAYFATREPIALRVQSVSPEIDLPFLPMVFDISLGVRHGETALRDRLEAAMTARQGEIDALLARYGVPRLDAGEPQ
jgi:mxaJ protein